MVDAATERFSSEGSCHTVSLSNSSVHVGAYASSKSSSVARRRDVCSVARGTVGRERVGVG